MRKSDISSDQPKGGSDKLVESEKRRRFIRSAVAGSGISILAGAGSKWSTPMVENVVLPAHATLTSLLLDPCDIMVTLEPSYRVQVSGNLLGPSGEIGGVNGSINVQSIGCLSEIIDQVTVPVTTEGDGSYYMLPNAWFGLGGVGQYVAEFRATVTFPGAASATCPANVKGCPGP